MKIELLSKIIGNLPQPELPFTIIGIAVFGSRVKKSYTVESDIDLLIAASGLPAKRHHRGKDISLLKKNLPNIPFDIMLLTKEEVVSNFKNHNPLFLDIATEGTILFDTGKFFFNIFEETKSYLKNSKIKKTDGGWIFPVKAGEPTYLSKISNEDFSKAMLKDAARELEVGKKLKDEAYFDKSVYHFQQAIEKYIKAILIAMGIFRKTHFVGSELKKLIDKDAVPGEWKERLSDAAQISEEIEPEVSLSRYPGISGDTLWLPFEEYQETDALKAEKSAEKVKIIAELFLSGWFGNKRVIK